MEISLIIPTYNRNDLLYRHLSIAYHELIGLDYEILVVNDSKTSEVIIPTEWSGNIHSINNPKQGVASARNLGASLAKSEKLIFIDDDMIISRKAVVRAMQYLDETKDACYNVNWTYPDELRKELDKYQFGRYLNHFGFTSLRGWLGHDFAWQENTVIRNEGVASPFLVISKECFDRAGGYDENFPFAGFEDYDFGKRLEKAGISSYIDTNILIQHNEEDRVQLDGWMQRKFRGGQTRKVAVNMGHKELELQFDNTKGKIYMLGAKFEPILASLMKTIPNYKFFDPLYFRIVNFLLGLNLYKGYTKT